MSTRSENKKPFFLLLLEVVGFKIWKLALDS